MKLLSLRTLLPLTLLVLGASVFMALLLSKPRAMALEPSEKVWVVDVEPVHLRTLAPTLALFGRIESPRSATLAAALAAEVTELLCLEGHAVPRGQLLVRLDDRDARLRLQQREAELAEIEAQITSERNLYGADLARLGNEQELLQLRERSVARLRRLQETNLASQAMLEEALLAREQQAIAVKNRQLNLSDHQARLASLRARRQQATAMRDMAALDVERTRVSAPFAGTVARVLVAPGDRVRAGDPLVEIYDVTTLEVRAQIPSVHQQTVSEALEAGQPLRATAITNGHPVALQLDRLSGMVSTGSGGVDGLFRFTAGEAPLRLGSFIELELTLPAVENVVAIPYEALYGAERAYRLVDGRMRAVRVNRIGEWRGPQATRRVLVEAGELRDGDALVVTQLPNAVDGLRVQLPQS